MEAPPSPAKKATKKKTVKKTGAKKAATAAPGAPKKKRSTGSLSGGKYIGAIISAIGALHTRGGVSRQAIKKHLEGQKDLDVNGSHIRLALHRGVETGTLKQTGQKFSLGDRAKAAVKKSTKKATTGTTTAKKPAKKTTTKKAKKSTTKKSAPRMKMAKKAGSKKKKTTKKTTKKAKAAPAATA